MGLQLRHNNFLFTSILLFVILESVEDNAKQNLTHLNNHFLNWPV